MTTTTTTTSLAIATRIHLGKASTPPPQSKLNRQIRTFLRFAASVARSSSSSSAAAAASYVVRVVVAVDAEERIPGYDLRGAVSRAVDEATNDDDDDVGGLEEVRVLPVTPWGNFVFALNASLAWAESAGAARVLYASLETTLTANGVRELCRHVDDDGRTLVAGAALPGHDFRGDDDGAPVTTTLDGRTSPWNTAAVWNVPRLAALGFPLIGDGVGGDAGGVEEVPTIALAQSVSPPGAAQAKLVRLDPDDVAWDEDFGDDEARREWHERKMASKTERAAAHLKRLGLSGTVTHLSSSSTSPSRST